MILHRWSGSFVVALPADSGLYLVLALPELSDLPRFRRSLEESYLEYIGPDLLAHATPPGAIADIIVYLVGDAAAPVSGAIVPAYGA